MYLLPSYHSHVSIIDGWLSSISTPAAQKRDVINPFCTMGRTRSFHPLAVLSASKIMARPILVDDKAAAEYKIQELLWHLLSSSASGTYPVPASLEIIYCLWLQAQPPKTSLMLSFVRVSVLVQCVAATLYGAMHQVATTFVQMKLPSQKKVFFYFLL